MIFRASPIAAARRRLSPFWAASNAGSKSTLRLAGEGVRRVAQRRPGIVGVLDQAPAREERARKFADLVTEPERGIARTHLGKLRPERLEVQSPLALQAGEDSGLAEDGFRGEKAMRLPRLGRGTATAVDRSLRLQRLAACRPQIISSRPGIGGHARYPGALYTTKALALSLTPEDLAAIEAAVPPRRWRGRAMTRTRWRCSTASGPAERVRPRSWRLGRSDQPTVRCAAMLRASVGGSRAAS